MKSILLSVLLVSASAAAGDILAQDDPLGLAGPYLGQTPPGDTPKPFAPGVVATSGWDYGLTFMPGLREAYYLREETETKQMQLMRLEQKDDAWFRSIVSPRPGQPVISPDGKTMHLGRRYKAWTATGWTDIQLLDDRFQGLQIMRMTSSTLGTYVFDEVGMPGGNGVLRYSRMVGGERQDPTPFGPEINSGKFNAHPFIAPDETYMIWDGRRDSGFGNSDLYISFRQSDGSWGEAINLGGKVNTDAWEAAAIVSPDGKYLFFNRTVGLNSNGDSNVDIMWVDAGIIEALRPKP